MKNLLIIPSYNMNNDCYEMTRNNVKLFNDFQTVIIDNNSSDTKYLNKLQNEGITVIKSKYGGRYEPGALLQCYEDFDAENYFIVQDSIEILDPEPFLNYISNHDEYILCLRLFYPAYHMMSEKNKMNFNKNFTKYRYLLMHEPGIASSSFICKRKHIEFLIKKNILIEKFLPNDKSGQEEWERIFGLAFKNLGITLKSFDILYDMLWSVTGKYDPEKYRIKNNTDVFKKIAFGRQ